MSYEDRAVKNTITVRLPDKLKKDLLEISRSENIPLSDLVRDSLERYANIHRFRRLRRKILPLAEAAGLLTDEDVFRAIS